MTQDTPNATAPTITVIVPTYREAENLPELIQRLGAMRQAHGLALSVLIMDDDSRDGTDQAVAEAEMPWVELVTRTHDRGLSPAVIDGIKRAQGEVVVVMDADLSHPPEAIPALLDKLARGHDFVIGSRYGEGGSTGEGWGVGRWLNSKVATWLARPLTRVKDPMAGFFAIERQRIQRGGKLNPVGYKIGLELLVKCRCGHVAEVPIHFAQRTRGQSKLTLRQQLLYLKHLRRLYLFRYPNRSSMAQFAVVGSFGVAVNLAALTLLLWAGLPSWAAVALAILISILANFMLNRRFTFSYARGGRARHQFVGYVVASSAGACVNYAAVMATLWAWPTLWPQAAALVGVGAGMGINYSANRYLVFRKPRAVPADDPTGTASSASSTSAASSLPEREAG